MCGSPRRPLPSAMGARLRRRSPPPLMTRASSASSSASARFPPSPGLVPAAVPRGDYRMGTNQAKWVGVVIGVGACVWMAAVFAMISVHEPPSEQRAHLPIPMANMRERAERAVHHLRHTHHRTKKRPKLPEHYVQLSPPTTKEDPHPWSWPIVHIVSTRFMQDQGSLVNLARSRLKLMEAVTLPSLMGQTIFNGDTLSEVYTHTKWEKEVAALNHRHKIEIDPEFLWFIKVDPNLDKTILNELLAVLEPVKEFAVVVGSNTNFGIGIKPGGWRDGQAGRDVLEAYDNGHVHFPGGENAIDVIRRAHEARDDRVVIETRLDADDAVHVDYIATLQLEAVRGLVDPDISGYDGYVEPDSEDADQSAEEEKDKETPVQTARWLYWCPHTHCQWNPSSSTHDPGMLQVFKMPQTCVTAGLSLGFAVGTDEESVPRYEHAKLYWQIAVNHNNKDKKNTTEGAPIDKHDCGLYPSSQCAVMVEDPRVSAFRSRAMTSAGMHNIEAQGESTVKTPKKYKEYAAQMWQKGTIERQFGIKTEKAKEVADFMQANYLATVKDNLKGQCTHGHSCKMSSLEKLQRTIDILEEETGGVNII